MAQKPARLARAAGLREWEKNELVPKRTWVRVNLAVGQFNRNLETLRELRACEHLPELSKIDSLVLNAINREIGWALDQIHGLLVLIGHYGFDYEESGRQPSTEGRAHVLRILDGVEDFLDNKEALVGDAVSIVLGRTLRWH